MSQSHRRESVREKIERLERSRTTLNLPIFDSSKDMNAEPASTSHAQSPLGERKSLESPTNPDQQTNSPKNTIRVIKQSDGGEVKVQVKLDSPSDRPEDALTVIVESTASNPDEEFSADVPAKEGIRESGTNKPDEDKTGATGKAELKGPEDLQENESKPKREEDVRGATGGGILDENKNKEDNKHDSTDMKPMAQEEIDRIVKKYWRMDSKTRDKYLEFFWSVDEFGFGYFTAAQLNNWMVRNRIRITRQQIVKIFSDLDKDSCKSVSLEEFMDEMSKRSFSSFTTEDFQKWFDWFDYDKDGRVGAADLEKRFSETYTLVDRVAIKRILMYDTSGKKLGLNFEDFCKCFKEDIAKDAKMWK